MAPDRPAADSPPAGTPAPDSSPLVGRVYEQLRAIAQRQMNQERSGHTLQATALVHEAYLRLAEAGVPWSGPGAFYHAAAEAMQRILIEHARSRGRVKRGGGRRRLDLEAGNVVELAEEGTEGIVALDDAIRRLEGADPRAASAGRSRAGGPTSTARGCSGPRDGSPRSMRRATPTATATAC